MATSEYELNLSLMWWFFLPQALLRKPFRGGREGRNMVAKRFNAISNGDWGKLVELWEKDKKAQEEIRIRKQRSNHTASQQNINKERKKGTK